MYFVIPDFGVVVVARDRKPQRNVQLERFYREEVISLRGVLRCENGGIVALEYQTGPLVGFLIEVAGKFPK